MDLSNYRRNRIGGVDADKTLDNGEIVPYTLTSKEINELSDVEIAEYTPPEPDKKTLMNNAFEFKGVSCSVREADQNGWEVVGSRINTLLDRGEDFRSIPFFMENGNVVILETHQEWLDFVDAGWAAREQILIARLSNV